MYELKINPRTRCSFGSVCAYLVWGPKVIPHPLNSIFVKINLKCSHGFSSSNKGTEQTRHWYKLLLPVPTHRPWLYPHLGRHSFGKPCPGPTQPVCYRCCPVPRHPSGHGWLITAQWLGSIEKRHKNAWHHLHKSTQFMFSCGGGWGLQNKEHRDLCISASQMPPVHLCISDATLV